MIILTYHQVSVRGGSSSYDIPADHFEAQIDALFDLGFSFVTLADVAVRALDDSTWWCAITFDDGRLGAFDQGSRILDARGIKATWYMCPGWLEQKPTGAREAYSDFMTWEHVSELARGGHVIGSHGMSHAALFDLDAVSAAQEIADSKRLIERRLGIGCEHFAPAWGQVDRRVMSLTRDAGYRSLSSMARGPNKPPFDLYRLRRLESSDYASLSRFRDAIGGYVSAHSRLDVAALTVRGAAPRKSGPDVDRLAGFDLVACLDARAYEFATELGLACVECPTGRTATRCEDIREWLPHTHPTLAASRPIAVTPLTLGGNRPAWTFLSSFLPTTSGRR